MSSTQLVELAQLMPQVGRSSVNPADFPNEVFDLLSIRAYDRGFPETARGAEIGSAKQLVQQGDVLLSKIVPHIRRSWVVGKPNHGRQIASSEWMVFRGASAYPGYLRHYLLSDGFHRQFMQTVSGIGGSLLRARPKHVAKIKIPLPPLEEQRRITGILDKALRIDELCAMAHELSQATERSLFLKFFADQPEANARLLSELADSRPNSIRTGPFGSQLLHREFTDSGVAVLGIDNAVNNFFEWGKRRYISNEKFQQLQRYKVFPGDLLITIMGTCGRAAVVPDDIPIAINTKHLCAISVDHQIVLPHYLHSYMLFHPCATRYLTQRSKGAIMEGLNMSIIQGIPVRVPSLENQLDWLKRREMAKSIAMKTLAMKSSALSLVQTSSSNLFTGQAA